MNDFFCDRDIGKIMKLNSVKIENFRSIPKLNIDFTNHNAIGLVGINESGKSNVLKALSLLSTDVAVEQSDVRVPRPDEPDVEESKVVFYFQLDTDEIDNLIKTLSTSTISKDGRLPPFKGVEGEKSFVEFAQSRSVIMLYVDINDSSKEFYTRLLDNRFEDVEAGWLSLRAVSDKSINIDWSELNGSLKDKVLINAEKIESLQDIPGAISLTAELLDLIWQDVVGDYAKGAMPQAMLWTFEKENMLPGSVSLEEFALNPSICKPLESMFELADVKNIPAEIRRERARGRQKLNNLLSRVASRTSKHLRTVWTDSNPASIELQLDGNDIRISVKDENLSFDFSDRSDGFKRFITFLLMVSAKIRNKKEGEFLLLIDEPEVSLHPSGIRNLRDELLRLSEKNLVVYSTHSPQMIDPTTVSRHLIVKKISESTTCTVAEAGAIFDEEVILNGLGTSLFESLKSVNIIFEGWRDKKLFEVYMTENNDTTLDSLRKCGLAFSQGVKDIRNIVPILTLGKRKTIIVTDHDAPALEGRSAFKEARLDGTWLTYRELEGDASVATTAEDFIRSFSLCKAAIDVCAKEGIDLELDEMELKNNNRLELIKRRLVQLQVDQQKIKKILDKIKSVIFDSLKISDIEENYSEVIRELAKITNKVIKSDEVTIHTLVVANV
jgi:energy-coupling factor transporter ATP-binding protein EcfA2